MSSTETCIGKLRTFSCTFNKDDLEKYSKNRMFINYPSKYTEYLTKGFPSWVKDWFDALNDELYDNNRAQLFYNEKTGELWESYNVKSLDEEYFCELINEGADTYTFVTQFYNGGTCLSEILEEEIENLTNYNKPMNLR